MVLEFGTNVSIFVESYPPFIYVAIRGKRSRLASYHAFTGRISSLYRELIRRQLKNCSVRSRMGSEGVAGGGMRWKNL